MLMPRVPLLVMLLLAREPHSASVKPTKGIFVININGDIQVRKKLRDLEMQPVRVPLCVPIPQSCVASQF